MPKPASPETEDAPEGRYSNYLRIGQNAYEFIFDFGQRHPPEKDYIHTRIVSSPSVAKQFLELLRTAIAEYNEKYDVRGNTNLTQ